MPTMCNNRTCGGGSSYCCHHGACNPFQGRRICVDAVKVAAGGLHSVFLAGDGFAWAAGDNAYGQLGDGTVLRRMTPAQVMEGVQAVHSFHHTLFVKRDGSLWGTGWNNKGQLGDGTTTDKLSPIEMVHGVRAASAGMSHSLFLRNDGTAWAVGDNEHGQLGDGTTTGRLAPVQVLTNVEAVSAGSHHSLFLKSDGTVWAAGWNLYGQLGDGTNVTRYWPVQVFSQAVSVEGGNAHTVFLKSDKTAWTSGHNQAGQLGDGTQLNVFSPAQVMTNVDQASAGSRHTLFLRADGTMWACGFNLFGQLGHAGGQANVITPTQVLGDVLAVSAGDTHSIIVRKNGWAQTTGSNGAAQLGDGTFDHKWAPVDVLDLWPTPTSTTTTTVLSTWTHTTTRTTRFLCEPNVFPVQPLEGYSAEGFLPSDVLWSSELLRPILEHPEYKVASTWTLSFKVTSYAPEMATFGMAGGPWFYLFRVPAGAQDLFIRMSEVVMYAGIDSEVTLLEYGGFPAKVGNVTFTNVYFAPGECQQEMVSFSYFVGEWRDCGAPCGGETGEQNRTVRCRGSDGNFYYDGFACYGQARPNSTRSCLSAPCPRDPGASTSSLVLDEGLLPALCALSGLLLCICSCGTWYYCRGQAKEPVTKIYNEKGELAEAEEEFEEEQESEEDCDAWKEQWKEPGAATKPKKKLTGRVVHAPKSFRKSRGGEAHQEAWADHENTSQNSQESQPLKEEPKDLAEAMAELAAAGHGGAPAKSRGRRRAADDFYGAGHARPAGTKLKRRKDEPRPEALLGRRPQTADSEVQRRAGAQELPAERLRAAASPTRSQASPARSDRGRMKPIVQPDLPPTTY